MLDLVVQPAVHEVVHITTCSEVGGTDHGTEVEVILSWLGLSLETIDVVTDVVRCDDDE